MADEPITKGDMGIQDATMPGMSPGGGIGAQGLPRDVSTPGQIEQFQYTPQMELGSTGLRRFNGYVFEEFLRELSGPRGVKVFREMADNDPIIGAMLFAIETLMRQVTWSTEAASTAPEDEAAADFVESCMDDLNQPWVETIVEILSMLPYGWSFHELVYKWRRGQSTDGSQNSRFTDGRLGWRKLAIRAQETLWKWHFDQVGGIRGFLQIPPPDYVHRYIPIEKGLLFRTKAHKNNPEGRSVLRNAYRPWFFKKHMENMEAIGAERDLAGMPVAWVPPRLLDDKNNTPADKAAFAAFQKMVINLKRDEQEGIVMPLSYDDSGNKQYDLTLLSTGGTRQFDTNAIIGRYDQRIAMTVLADFILLGHEKVGSFALSSNKSNIFATAMAAFATSITDVFNRIAIPRLFELNGWRLQKLPKIVFGDIGGVDLKELGEFIGSMTKSGMQLFPNNELESYLKRQAGLPVDEIDPGYGATGYEPGAQAQPGAPAMPAPVPDAALAGADMGAKPSDKALTGQQIQQMVAIISQVATKQLDRGTGIALLQNGFSLDQARAEAIMGQTGATFFTAPPAPAAPPEAPE